MIQPSDLTFHDLALEQTDDTTLLQQTRGCFRIVKEYMNQLYELGLYDNTDIIIIADHGYWYLTMEDITEPTSPVMMVKTQKSTETLKDLTASNGEDVAQYCGVAVSDNPISYLDLQGSILASYHIANARFGTTIYDSFDPARIHFF